MFLRSHLSRLEITIAEVREMATVQKGSWRMSLLMNNTFSCLFLKLLVWISIINV
jgi:hypothetical protein